jgi:hypothetical protein
MQYAVLIAIVAAAAVSATKEDRTAYPSKTYGGKPLPPHQHYDCDATAKKCYAPKSYGKSYDHTTYSYHREYDYPGPKARFCAKLKHIGHAIKNIFKKIGGKFKRSWLRFKGKWNKWCAVKRSDKARFDDWKACKAEKFKSWWEYHHDLCKTRKALWDDAMREFHRQWCHFKQTCRADYEKKKKEECKIEEKDYDEDDTYKKNINKYGVTPVEDSYHNYSTGTGGVKYEQAKYEATCKERDAKYQGKHGDIGNAPGKLPEPVGGDVAPVAPVGQTPAPVSG